MNKLDIPNESWGPWKEDNLEAVGLGPKLIRGAVAYKGVDYPQQISYLAVRSHRIS